MDTQAAACARALRCLNGACANVLYSAHSDQHPTLRRDPSRSIRAGDEPLDARVLVGYGRVVVVDNHRRPVWAEPWYYITPARGLKTSLNFSSLPAVVVRLSITCMCASTARFPRSSVHFPTTEPAQRSDYCYHYALQ